MRRQRRRPTTRRFKRGYWRSAPNSLGRPKSMAFGVKDGKPVGMDMCGASTAGSEIVRYAICLAGAYTAFTPGTFSAATYGMTGTQLVLGSDRSAHATFV